MTSTLDTFEQSLLTELRRHVAERPAPQLRRRSRTRRWAATGAGLVAAGSVAAGAVLLQPGPAFAVQEEADGDIVVTIASLKDADGLERALEEHGVEAEVTYGADDLLPDVREVPPPSGDDPGPRMETGGETAAEPPAGPLACDVIAVELRGGEITFRLPAEAVAAASPLQIRTAGETDGWSAIAVQWERPVC
ncbi:hypothetical protein GUY44_12370 [Pimelobacter simplex]|uniref:Uncharacterized protein n=1 Tax=Nocardioides simplex TaxID=2045 RepID=A0A0C5WXU7_NOCSI|nr:hypothetical protein [Pimelobacter simplex]AJR18123.1 hypothetical protein KR76_04470 [Pimelobacter simplex]MCG8151277.1 hypothetical protein [Pimelobacter simplex]GEB12170.1 hypothetical protein NSI01_04850 [Pimelobacter simplex]SFN17123.1 hypothetical protein SAMN05421671_5530 [Pimelobacter simplex]